MDTSRLHVDTQCLADNQMLPFRLGGFAHMQCALVRLFEDGCNPYLSRKQLAQATPAGMDPLIRQSVADDLYELVSQYGDEQMSIGPFFFVMKDGPQAQFGFE